MSKRPEVGHEETVVGMGEVYGTQTLSGVDHKKSEPMGAAVATTTIEQQS